LVKCSEEDLQEIDPAAVAGKRRGAFGTEALVLKEAIPGGMLTDTPTIEDIMLYFIKEED
ncbi:MAG: ABC transporter ATP-binding protein, partial [Eubacterium sp.]